MILSRFSPALIPLFVFSVLVLSKTGDPPMFLCIDDSSGNMKNRSGKESQKLVYGYINGKKTPCMSEYELRSTYSKEVYDLNKQSGSDSRRNRQKQRNAVYRGEKNLSGADLRGFDLQGFDLSGTNLRNARLDVASAVQSSWNRI